MFLGYTSDREVGGSDDDAVLSQPIDVFGRTTAARSLGDAQVMQAEAQLRGTLLDLQTEVLEAYAEAAAADELASTAEQTLEIAQRLSEATRRRVEEGISPGVQLTRVMLELDRARLAARRRQAERAAAIRRLSGATATPAEGNQVGAFESIEVALGPTQFQSLRPDLLALASEVRIAEAEARIARLGLAPELEVQARRTPWQEREVQYGGRVQLAFPIFDHGRTRAESSAAQRRADAARRALEDATLLAQAELDVAQTELASARQQVASYESIVQQARTLVERQRTGLIEGAATLFEVLEAARALREVQEAYVEARLALARAQARALRAGGHVLEVGGR